MTENSSSAEPRNSPPTWLAPTRGVEQISVENSLCNVPSLSERRSATQAVSQQPTHSVTKKLQKAGPSSLSVAFQGCAREGAKPACPAGAVFECTVCVHCSGVHVEAPRPPPLELSPRHCNHHRFSALAALPPRQAAEGERRLYCCLTQRGC